MPPTPLTPLLQQKIRTSGPLTVAEYMEMCLYHPLHGYYTRGLNFSTTPPLDFLTAPDHTPLFAFCLANAVARWWASAGQPTPFTLAEAGPGRGILMRDLFTHLATAHPACAAAARVALIEVSPTLRQLQSTTLGPLPHTHLPSVEDLPLPALLVANELLDAYPVHQFTSVEGAPHEVHVTLTETGAFTFTPLPTEKSPPVPEYSPAQHAFLTTLARRKIPSILIDYGSLTPAENTLQAIYRHQKVSPFHRPGETDLTTHVNFTLAQSVLGEAHCTLTDLAPFLLTHGLPELGLQHPSEQPALLRLLHPAEMGTLFKVLCFTPNTR